jgi:hypothetical protein
VKKRFLEKLSNNENTKRYGGHVLHPRPGDLVNHDLYNMGIVVETNPPNPSPMSFVQDRKTFRVYFPHMNKSMWCLGDKMNIVSFGNVKYKD